MKCRKCGFITFDHFDDCPKCKTSFTEIKESLNIIDYNLTKNNNYLLPEIIEKEEEKKEEIKKEEKVIQEEQELSIKDVFKEEDTEEEEEEGISITKLLEQTRFEEDK